MKNIQKKSGFTLVELLVVIGIISIMTGAVVVNYRNGGRIDLQRTVVDISQKIREIEEMALAAKKIDGSVPTGGYGVYFSLDNKSSYIIFADKDEDGFYDPSEQIRKEEIGANVEISNTDLGDSLSIVFIPPDPKVKINNDFNNSYAQITFKRQKEFETIYINKIGLISIF